MLLESRAAEASRHIVRHRQYNIMSHVVMNITAYHVI